MMRLPNIFLRKKRQQALEAFNRADRALQVALLSKDTREVSRARKALTQARNRMLKVGA